MPFKRTPEKFSSSIGTAELGVGESKIVLGGESVYPFCTFDGEIANAPKVGVEISDMAEEEFTDGLKEFYAGCSTLAQMAKKADTIEGCDFICLHLESADPNGANKSVEDCVAEIKEVAAVTDKPLVIAGCKNTEKDAQLFEKAADALQGKNILVMSCKEENYKTVGAAAGLAYSQKVGAESAVDINLAKQLNVLLTQLGVHKESIIMNVGSAAAGYGFEYVATTLDRVKSAALAQNDNMLQMPIITPVAFETWTVKESVMPEADMPEWGSREDRGINMEVITAAACLAGGSNAVILRHPESVATIKKLIGALI